MSKWLNWEIGKQPVNDDVLVDLEYRNRDQMFGFPAGEYNWSDDLGDFTITRWKVSEDIR